MAYYVFVDNSNVWIEGKFVSAVINGHSSNIYEAHNNNTQDNSWAIDFGRLLYQVTETDITDVKKAVLFGSKPTDKDSLWDAMRQSGFTVINKERNAANKEKQIDTGIVAEILKTLYTEAAENDVFVLVMGDSDYVPIMRQISEKGIRTTVAFWDHASGELRQAADKFLSLNGIINRITYA